MRMERVKSKLDLTTIHPRFSIIGVYQASRKELADMSEMGMASFLRGARALLENRSAKEPEINMRVLMVMCSPDHARGSICTRISSGRRA